MHEHPQDTTRPGTPGPTAQRPEDPPESADPADAAVRHLLHDGVPLSLLVDLGTPSGPDSAAILDAEGAPDSEWWRQP